MVFVCFDASFLAWDPNRRRTQQIVEGPKSFNRVDPPSTRLGRSLAYSFEVDVVRYDNAINAAVYRC
jgi:hypothetical protein